MLRASTWFCVATVLACGSLARGEFILTSASQSVGVNGSNANSIDTTVGFPYSNTLSASGVIGAGLSTVTDQYTYSLVGGVTSLDWTVSESQGGSVGSSASVDTMYHFTPTTDGTYTFTSDWNGLENVGNQLALIDQFSFGIAPTFSQTLFDDERVAVLGSFAAPVGSSYSGTLSAGVQYTLVVDTKIASESYPSPSSTSATGHFNFTFMPSGTATSPVPEPDSLTLVGMGVCGLACCAVRRRSRRQKPVSDAA